jgi:hypothetical protein
MNNAAKEHSIFLTYARSDASWVAKFADALNSVGIQTVSDVDVLRAGESFEDGLRDALRQSDTLIVLFSPNSLNNPNVYFELGAALVDDKDIILVLIGDVDEKQIPFTLTRWQWIRASSPSEAAKQVAYMLEAGAQNGSKPH